VAETILLVEDDDTVRCLLARMLRRGGYQVLEAASAGRAEEVSRSHGGSLDLLLSDVVLSEGTGPQLGEALVREYPELRRLYMSGYPRDMIGPRGIDDRTPFLQKPFSKDVLLDRVREALGDSPRSWPRA
jgi:two-component system, cell cycle sensor histidine kinase and response regulator CckA